MFINICHNFLVADQQLRDDIELLVQITKQIAIFNNLQLHSPAEDGVEGRPESRETSAPGDLQ